MNVEYALTLSDEYGAPIAAIGYDGSVWFASWLDHLPWRKRHIAKRFWKLLGNTYPHKGCVAPDPYRKLDVGALCVA